MNHFGDIRGIGLARRQRIGRRIVGQIPKYGLISLDVFDTAILRAVAAPTDVFSLVKLKLMKRSEALLYPETLDVFPVLRVEAEKLAAASKLKKQGTPEITLDEIYGKLASMLPTDPEWLATIKATELELETQLAYPDPTGLQIWEAAIEKNKTVVFCSDMYLPGAFIASLLKKCGYTSYDALYVSCELAKSKHEGTLLPYIASQHKISPKRILHAGDNEHADFIMAGRSGCCAIHFPLHATPRETVIPLGNERPFYSKTVFATIQGVVRKSDTTGPPNPDALERLGYRVFGPLLTGFMLWLATIAERNQPDKILLFARDTYFIDQHLKRFLGPRGKDIPMEYIYVSRGSLMLPSFTDFPLTRLWHLFSGKSPKPVADHLRKLGLNPELLTSVIQSVGYESAKDLVKNGDKRMHALLTKLHGPLLAESAKQRPPASGYLHQVTGGATRLMLVDIGWVGNMQACFLRLLQPLKVNLQVRGYYMGIYGYARENDYPGHTMEGWITHYGEPGDLEQKVWCAGGAELIEFALCAPHGTTLGYTQTTSGEVKPVLESSKADAGIFAQSARVQNGAAQFLEEYLDTYAGIPAEALVSRVWANEFYRLVTNPAPEEAELLGGLTHSDSAGDTKRRLPIAKKLEGASQDELLQALEQSYWKAGFRIRNGMAGNA